MRKNFEALRQLVNSRFSNSGAVTRDPKLIMRVVLGALVLLNLIAVWMVISPPGGSAEDLEAQLTTLRAQLVQKKAALARTKEHSSKTETSSQAGREFELQYFTDRRVASSTFLGELARAAKEVGIKPKEHIFLFDPVEGSDVLNMMTITANYEGTYADLLQFVNRLDRSSRFLILDTLSASPQQGTGMLNVTVKINAFVKETPNQL